MSAAVTGVRTDRGREDLELGFVGRADVAADTERLALAAMPIQAVRSRMRRAVGGLIL